MIDVTVNNKCLDDYVYMIQTMADNGEELEAYRIAKSVEDAILSEISELTHFRKMLERYNNTTSL